MWNWWNQKRIRRNYWRKKWNHENQARRWFEVLHKSWTTLFSRRCSEIPQFVKVCFAISPWTCWLCNNVIFIVDSEKCFEECWIKNPKIQNYLLETLFNGRHKYNVKLKLWINQLLLLNKSIFINTNKFEDNE